GTAACLLKAVTSHRLLGLKLDLSFNPRSDAKAFIQQLDVLFIDEVSMMHRRHFEAVDSVLQKLRGNSLPFGGVSIVLVGDLFQLPPVLDSQQQLEQFLPFGGSLDRDEFLFKSPLWGKFSSIVLKENCRQAKDPAYANLLNRVRVDDM